MLRRTAVRITRIFLLALGALALLSGTAYSQATTGTPPLGSFGGSHFDTIDLGNLDVHFCIPIVHKAGRGLPFDYSLCYDSLIWIPVTSNGVTTWTPATNWGWRAQTDAATGYVSNTSNQSTCYNGRSPGGTTTTYSNWIYYDAAGTSHAFSGTTQVIVNFGGTGNPCPPAKTTTLTAYAQDDSGYQLNATGGGGYVVGKNGTKFNPLPLNTPTGAGTVTDRNGNQLSVNGSGVYTDTLGSTSSTPLTITGTTSIGSSSSPTLYKYYPPSGTQTYVQMSYKSYTVRAQFGCSGINAYGPTTVYMVDKVTLPDNSYYAFTYELDADQVHYPGDITGRIKSVSLPTGGMITYNYTANGTNGIFCSDGTTAGFNRVAGGETWSYTRASTTQTTVQDPVGNQEVVTFSSSGYETQRQVYQGAQSGGNVIQSQITCYNNNTTNCPAATVTAPITQRTVSQNLTGTGGKVSKQSTTYNTAGLPTEVDDFDWGATTPARKTIISYASLTNGILDRPSQISVKDASNAVWAQTTYTYDEGTPQPTTGTQQHQSVTGSRGNPTTISYLAGSTSLTKHFSYYDTGNVYQATDVNGAVTTYSYSSTACSNAFVASVALPVGGMTRSQTWNCTGAVVTSTTDENGQSTTAAFTDANFWRPSSLTDPLSNALQVWLQRHRL